MSKGHGLLPLLSFSLYFCLSQRSQGSTCVSLPLRNHLKRVKRPLIALPHKPLKARSISELFKGQRPCYWGWEGDKSGRKIYDNCCNYSRCLSQDLDKGRRFGATLITRAGTVEDSHTHTQIAFVLPWAVIKQENWIYILKYNKSN